MMRAKPLLVSGVALMVVGCATPYIGMTQQEFLSSHLGASLYSANAQSTIYTWWEGGLQPGYGFYYFTNGRLVQIDHGQPQQIRVQQEIINK